MSLFDPSRSQVWPVPETLRVPLLKDLRLAHRESLADMAERLGVRVSFLSSIEVGKKPLTPDVLEKITDVYSLSVYARAEIEPLVNGGAP